MKKRVSGGGLGLAPAKTLPTVLYVEDEEENWDITQARLRDRFQLVWARNDREACEAARTCGALHAILMDIQLKGSQLDGIQLTALFRERLPPGVARPSYAEHLPTIDAPIIFVTAYGSRYSPEELRALGGSSTITKPVDFLRLNLALASAQARSVLGILGS